VVDDQVGDDADAELVGLPREIAERVIARIDAVIVGDIVALVTTEARDRRAAARCT
jgi:hypothetical protein